MDDIPLQALIPIGVISAALIAGFFSLLSLIVSKEQKVSEFRQQWIDNLRQEISDHIAALISLSTIFETAQNIANNVTEVESNLRQRVTATYTSIKLRINPEDSNTNIRTLNQEVLRLLDEERALFNESKWREARLKCNEITSASIPMLKEEWKRVKKGESVYVWSKRGAIAIFMASAFSLAYLSYEYWPSTKKPVSEASEVSEGLPANTSLEAQSNEVHIPSPKLPESNNE